MAGTKTQTRRSTRLEGVTPTAEDVMKVLGNVKRPLSTSELNANLGHLLGVDPDTIIQNRLRRVLNNLSTDGTISASGGPTRDSLDGWPEGDKRDVHWATFAVGIQIRERVADEIRFEREVQEERARLLKELHKLLTSNQREELGLVGIHADLKGDPTFDNGGKGAPAWTLPQLRTVIELAGGDA